MQQLRADYCRRQAAAMERALARERRNLRTGLIAGGLIGLLAVAVTAGMTRHALFWHSFLLESLVCAAAGYFLARRGGGSLQGLLLLSGAYLVAWLLRAIGVDPSVLFESGDLGRVAMVHGNVTSLCLTLACGAAIGHIIQDG